MAIYCNLCGKENKDGSVICESCGNMLVDIFSAPVESQTRQAPPLQQNEFTKAKFGPNLAGQPVHQKVPQNNVVQISPSMQQEYKLLGDLSGYLFKIGGLTDIKDFVEIAEKSRNDSGLSSNDRNDVIKKLEQRAYEVFDEEIDYFEEKGSFAGNLKVTLLCLIAGIILGAIFVPLGVICYLAMAYYACRTIARLCAFSKSHVAAKIVKQLKKAGIPVGK